MMRFSAASAEATFFKGGYTGLVYAMLVVKSSVGMITMLLVFFIEESSNGLSPKSDYTSYCYS